MAEKRTTAKTSKINRADPVSSSLLERYCRGLDTWPRSWMGWEKDLPPGEELVACFRPFLEHLVGSDLSPNTIQKHVDNVWLLGGEIIRDLNQDPSLRKLPADRLLHRVIGDDGGPLIHNGSEEEQNSFDSTCRRLHRFLTPHSARLRRGKRGRKLAWVIGNPGHNPARVTHRFPRPSEIIRVAAQSSAFTLQVECRHSGP